MIQTIPSVTICSVENEDFYRRLFVVAPTDENPDKLGRATEYRLSKPDRNKVYSTLKVYAGMQYPTQYGLTQNGSEPPSPPQPVSPMEIARDLLDDWQGAGLHSNGLPKGLIVIADDVPTQEELEKATQMKWTRMRTLVMKADQRIANGSSLDTITPEDVKAALEIGETRTWADPQKRMSKKSCLACGEIINADALKCSSCGTDLETFYLEQAYTIDDIKEIDSYVFKNIDAKNKRKSRVPKPAVTVK